MFEVLPQQGSLLFGMADFDRPGGRIDREVRDGDTLELGGELRFRFLSTPGHTPGRAVITTIPISSSATRCSPVAWAGPIFP